MNDRLLDQVKKMIPDRRILINGAAKRAAELARGARALVPVNPEDEESYLDVALREIVEGKVIIHAPETRAAP
ncbi:MAG: DNA-directed RNA polymerase subunit omega [Lentisphaeria bacterium]